MNNKETVSTDDLKSLGTVLTISALSFYVVYESTYFLYEKLYSQRDHSESRSCLKDYQKWSPLKKADFISRITS